MLGLRNDNEKVLTTVDIYVAAYLHMMGIPVTCRDEGAGKVIFDFAEDPLLDTYISQFRSNVLIPVASYTAAIKGIRNQMRLVRGVSVDDMSFK